MEYLSRGRIITTTDKYRYYYKGFVIHKDYSLTTSTDFDPSEKSHELMDIIDMIHDGSLFEHIMKNTFLYFYTKIYYLIIVFNKDYISISSAESFRAIINRDMVSEIHICDLVINIQTERSGIRFIFTLHDKTINYLCKHIFASQHDQSCKNFCNEIIGKYLLPRSVKSAYKK